MIPIILSTLVNAVGGSPVQTFSGHAAALLLALIGIDTLVSPGNRGCVETEYYPTSVWLTIEQFQLVVIGVWLDLGLILRKSL